MMTTNMIDEQLLSLSQKYKSPEIGMGFLWGVYVVRNLAAKRPVSFIGFEKIIRDNRILEELLTDL